MPIRCSSSKMIRRMTTPTAVAWGASMVSMDGMIPSSILIGTGDMAIGRMHAGEDTPHGTTGIILGIIVGTILGMGGIIPSGTVITGDGMDRAIG